MKMTPTKQYIIEHRRRGAYVGMVPHHLTGEIVPKFMWSITRTDPKVETFTTEGEAHKILDKIDEVVGDCSIIAIRK